MDIVHIGTAMFCQIGSDVCVNFEVNKHFIEFSEDAQVKYLMNVKMIICHFEFKTSEFEKETTISECHFQIIYIYLK